MSEVNEVVEVPAAEAPVTGTEIGNAESSGKEVAVDASSTEAPALPTYTPNYKFRATSEDEKKGEEREFDEFVRSAIKDADTEKKARELYEKAYGLDFIKPKYEDLKKKYPEMEGQYSKLNGTVNEILDLKDKDLGAFFEAVRLPEDKVAQWMLEKIKKLDLPPEQRQVYDQLEETRRQNMAMEKQFQMLETQHKQQAVQARTLELETVLQRPDINSFAQAFDTARKTPGSFKEEVKKCGHDEFKVNGRDLSAEEATSIVMSRYNGLFSPQASVESPSVSVEQPLPVIPRLNGKAVSATGKKPRSIDDLKKISASLS